MGKKIIANSMANTNTGIHTFIIPISYQFPILEDNQSSGKI
jgi:hypothetical protein